MWRWGGSPPPPAPSWWWISITRTGPVCSRRRDSPPPAPTPPRSGLRFGMARTTVGTSRPSPVVRGGGGPRASAPRSGEASLGAGGVLSALRCPLSLAEASVPLLDSGAPGITPGPLLWCHIRAKELGGFLLQETSEGKGSPWPHVRSSCLESNSFATEGSFLPPWRVGSRSYLWACLTLNRRGHLPRFQPLSLCP